MHLFILVNVVICNAIGFMSHTHSHTHTKSHTWRQKKRQSTESNLVNDSVFVLVDTLFHAGT